MEEEEKKENKEELMPKELKKSNTLSLVKCPFCYEDNQQNPENSKNKIESKICCIKCNKFFFFIKCFHCSRKIYYKQEMSFINLIIKCPYIKCLKVFSISSCDLCNTKIYFNGRYPLKCPNKSCNNVFYKKKCPIKECDNVITLNFKNENKNIYKEGDLLVCNLHEPKFIFQEVNCYHCSRSLIWVFPQRGLIGGQKIKCVYEDCKKNFNLINCPKCNKSNFFPNGEDNIFGIEIKCINCNNGYYNIFCPICLKNFTVSNDYVEGNIIQCPYGLNKIKSIIDIPHADKFFQIVNCIFCKRPNIFLDSDKKPYYHGQKVICQYSDCQKVFCKLPCPFCMRFNIFPKAEFYFGAKITCVFENCKKTFRIFICPNCSNYQVETKDILEGQIIKCMKCETHFFSVFCPHCRKNILGKNTKLSFGQSVLCPYKNCQRLFSYLYCCKCKRPLYDKNNAYSDEVLINCPYKDCKTRFINCLCPNCFRNNFTIIKRDNENENIDINFKDLMECIHCKNKFMPQKRFNIFNEGIIMEFIQGKTIYFNEAIKEPNQIIRTKNLLSNNSEIYKLIENDNNKIIQLGQSVNDTTMLEQVVKNDERIQCCFCLENKSESVFIPCGHRCVCFKCGEIIMKSQNKKCPICQEEAFYLLKRVYDS